MDQKILKEELIEAGAEAYVAFDYEMRHPLARLEFQGASLSRKVALVYKEGARPIAICHLIDSIFIGEGFDKRIYRDYREYLSLLSDSLKDEKVLLADYSNKGLLPRVSHADYGSLDYLRILGKTFVSSGDLLSRLFATYGEQSLLLQRKANEINLRIKDEAFRLIKEDIERNGRSDELRIQKFIADRYKEEGMFFDDPPIVAINNRASNPHFAPSENDHAPIGKGDLVLIDMWAKMDDPLGVYSDITWMGFCGTSVPEKPAEAFSVLKDSIDLAFDFLKEELPKRKVCGHEVDALVRDYIDKAGYGGWFTHRTGHSIALGDSPHGSGPNIDDFESHDDRRLLPCTSFSLEPGIYRPDFGLRSETNVYLDKDLRPEFIAGRQERIIPILSL